jgi:hypothetical protein
MVFIDELVFRHGRDIRESDGSHRSDDKVLVVVPNERDNL